MKLLFFLLVSIPFFVAVYLLLTNLKKMRDDRNKALKARKDLKNSNEV